MAPYFRTLVDGIHALLIDRIFLSYYSIDTLNAATNAGTAVFLLLALPTAIIAIAEVFVGKLHGQNDFKEISKPVWQMIWFSFMSSPLVWMTGIALGPLLFYSANQNSENAYFFTNLLFTPAFGIVIA